MTETPTNNESLTIGFVLFDGAEELDWVGPFEVFTMARQVAEGVGRAASIRAVLISRDGQVVEGAKGMRVEVDASFDTAPPLDVLLIPGGIGTRAEMKRPDMLDFLRKKAAECEWVTSVCTGSAVLADVRPLSEEFLSHRRVQRRPNCQGSTEYLGVRRWQMLQRDR